MFYSHEILSNNQYGVSTIWLVATVGKTSHRRLTRKAIQDVNVPKACETIIDPGAPLALRLQGSLLYGVSRVFSQQCHYVLSDAEKTQSDMLMFFRVMKTSELDPKAGKAKRHQITLQDDPNFDITNMLSNFDLFTDKELFSGPSQTSTQSVSQMTPRSQPSFSSSDFQQLLPFDLPQSSLSTTSQRLRSDLGQTSPRPGILYLEDPRMSFNPFGEEDIDPFAGIGLDIDADGNVIEMADPEPDLPVLPGLDAQDFQITGPKSENLLHPNKGDNVFVVGEDALPDAEPFPKRARVRTSTTSDVLSSETSLSQHVVTHLRRGRPRKVPQMVDETDRIPRSEFLDWSKNYLEKMDASRNRLRGTTPAQARKNATALLFENGIANIGTLRHVTKISHPLVKEFSGTVLKESLQNKRIETGEDSRHGQRRSSSEAFEDGTSNVRRVRQRHNENDEIGLARGDDLIPELGMDAVPPLEDYHSSSMVPGSRPPSVVLGPVPRGPESAQKSQPDPSPLFERGRVIDPIRRFSNVPGSVLGSDDLLHLEDAQGYSFGEDGPEFSDNRTGPHGSTQDSVASLDNSCAQVLITSKEIAHRQGRIRPNDHPLRRWVSFEEIANPAIHDKRLAARAFLHVLSLLSKDKISVEQEGIAEQRPFGAIQLGVILDPEIGEKQGSV
ncbi:Rec8 like protein-domain-containing protein [Mariannaea sp. PMI_226]|nr:Rec8 like protein-domain-containing protein [Mariannaea sp. PMI_226]